jgi:hypothetical protein
MAVDFATTMLLLSMLLTAVQNVYDGLPTLLCIMLQVQGGFHR